MITQYKHEIIDMDTGVVVQDLILSAPLSVMVGHTIRYGAYGTSARIKAVEYEFMSDGVVVVIKV